MAVLKLQNVQKWFGEDEQKLTVLSGVDLTVEQ